MFRFLRNVIASFSVVFIVSYGIAKCIREITKVSVMCHYLMTNELIYDRMNTLYKKKTKGYPIKYPLQWFWIEKPSLGGF